MSESIKVFTNTKSIREFEGFTLQQGFIFGFINEYIPFVSNGTVFKDYVNVYFVNDRGEWQTRRVYKNTALYGKIATAAERSMERAPKRYATALEIESARVDAIRAEGVESALYKRNDISRKADAKCKPSQKRIRNYITEMNHLQTH